MSDGIKQTDKAMRAYTIIAIIAFLFVIIVMAATYGLLHSDQANRGTFGDMFGVANAFFSGVVFVGVTYAIFLQRAEIRIAREDIKYTKEILDEQQKHLALQNEETKRQIFENTFFQLLRLLTDTTERIDLTRSGAVIAKGKDMFPIFVERLRTAATSEGNEGRPLDAELSSFSRVYDRFYADNHKELGHYFRVLYNVLKFIDHSKMNDRKFYTNIVRAQLSDAEAAIIFHNGLSVHGREKLKPLLEKYAVLKNVRDRDLLRASLKNFYASEAFG